MVTVVTTNENGVVADTEKLLKKNTTQGRFAIKNYSQYSKLTLTVVD